MTDEARVAPENVYSQAISSLPEGAILTGCIVLLEYAMLDDTGPWLSNTTDQHSPVWKHLGMVESAKGDYLERLRCRQDDE